MGAGAMFSALGDIFGSFGSMAYNAYAAERDFKYQQDLQNKIFEREDNAVQRRMADLNAAGLNPNLAAGSAAGAGAVVGRSSTPQMDFKAGFLDALQAANQIALQKQETKNKQLEGDILSTEKALKERENLLDEMSTLYSLGFNVHPYVNRFGNLTFMQDADYYENENYLYGHPAGANLLLKNIDAQSNYMLNSANMLQKNIDWYNFNQIMSAVTDVGSLALPKINFSKRMK